jgi:hypothetical protein
MAEVAIGLFSALGAGATAAAGAVGSAASAIGAGLGGLTAAGSSALGILQGVATAASVASTLVGGIGSYEEGQQQAQIAKLQGNSEYIASEQKALQIRRDLVQKVGAARVAFAGSGLDISSAGAVESDLRNQADYATAIEKTNAEQAKAMAALRASQYRSNGLIDLAGAGLKGVGQAGGYGLDIAKRG